MGGRERWRACPQGLSYNSRREISSHVLLHSRVTTDNTNVLYISKKARIAGRHGSRL
jgi:hypothetical protein